MKSYYTKAMQESDQQSGRSTQNLNPLIVQNKQLTQQQIQLLPRLNLINLFINLHQKSDTIKAVQVQFQNQSIFEPRIKEVFNQEIISQLSNTVEQLTSQYQSIRDHLNRQCSIVFEVDTVEFDDSITQTQSNEQFLIQSHTLWKMIGIEQIEEQINQIDIDTIIDLVDIIINSTRLQLPVREVQNDIKTICRKVLDNSKLLVIGNTTKSLSSIYDLQCNFEHCDNISDVNSKQILLIPGLNKKRFVKFAEQSNKAESHMWTTYKYDILSDSKKEILQLKNNSTYIISQVFQQELDTYCQIVNQDINIYNKNYMSDNESRVNVENGMIDNGLPDNVNTTHRHLTDQSPIQNYIQTPIQSGNMQYDLQLLDHHFKQFLTWKDILFLAIQNVVPNIQKRDNDGQLQITEELSDITQKQVLQQASFTNIASTSTQLIQQPDQYTTKDQTEIQLQQYNKQQTQLVTNEQVQPYQYLNQQLQSVPAQLIYYDRYWYQIIKEPHINVLQEQAGISLGNCIQSLSRLPIEQLRQLSQSQVHENAQQEIQQLPKGKTIGMLLYSSLYILYELNSVDILIGHLMQVHDLLTNKQSI